MANIYEMMLNILSPWGNENLHHNEIAIKAVQWLMFFVKSLILLSFVKNEGVSGTLIY